MIDGVSCRLEALQVYVQVGRTDPSRLCLAGHRSHVGKAVILSGSAFTQI